MSSRAKRMMSLFGGYRGAHGTHGDMRKNPEKGGKLEIKQSARTLREPVTEELWESHLRGDYFLGIIPIDEEGNSVFGCIDVDQYDINLSEVVTKVESRGLPLVVCRSKSGGAHVYLFLREPEPAADMRAKLRQIAASMGWGGSEIFPKQNQILGERGDLGNWLNMPYQRADSPDRYAVKKTTAAMSLEEFISFAQKRRTSLSSISVSEPKDDSLDDAPPCLQHLCTVGFPEGQRNNGFVALATFCKKKFGHRWSEKLEEYNRKYFSPPRPADEVSSLIKRMENKDYNYRCKDQPICNYCNVSLCRTRKFGVGGGGQYPEISGLSKLDSEPPIWFLDIEDKRLELNTRQLQNYRDFQHACMEQLTVTFMPLRADVWLEMVGKAMESALIIEAAPEMSTLGHFTELLEEFCTDSYAGTKMEDLWLGKPYFDEKEMRHYFRLKDLMHFLERNGFKTWGRNKVGEVVTDMGGKKFYNINKKGLSTFWVPADFGRPPEVDLPDRKESGV